jgi:hypothetical protein
MFFELSLAVFSLVVVLIIKSPIVVGAVPERLRQDLRG